MIESSSPILKNIENAAGPHGIIRVFHETGNGVPMEAGEITRQIKAYVETRLRGPVDAGDLARRIGFSEAHIRDVFTRDNGIPLAKYITERRIANAAFDILYTQESLLEISLDYGYEHYDTFSRAFRRVTGCLPVDFRRARPRMERRSLGGGLFGVDLIRAHHERKEGMNKKIQRDEHSVLLYDVPKAYYGAYGGCTPYPISLKACANYLGEDIDYADAITGCGAAFRLAWNTKEWDGGNVDVCHTYSEENPSEVYIQGVTALGRAYKLLHRSHEIGKEVHKAFLLECLRKGVPVIAMGMVGPPEAGLVTGFRDDGDTMLGWSVFQDFPDFRGSIRIDDSGYYITDRWWENGVDCLIAMGEKICEPITPEATARRALEAMRPRMDGPFAKGLAAYDAWARDMEDDGNFPDLPAGGAWANPEELKPVMEILGLRLMCQGDGADCLADGRSNAAKYFARHSDQNALYAEAANAFQRTSDTAMAMYRVLGSWERRDPQILALGQKNVRTEIIRLIRLAKEADEEAMKALEKSL